MAWEQAAVTICVDSPSPVSKSNLHFTAPGVNGVCLHVLFAQSLARVVDHDQLSSARRRRACRLLSGILVDTHRSLLGAEQ